jgi:hypothetical protein
MAHDEKRNNRSELVFRFKRIKKQMKCTELKYHLALESHKPKEILEDLKSDLENLNRKLNWFAEAIRKYM